MNKQVLKLLPLLIILVGVLGFVALVSSRQAPERRVRQDLGPLVEAMAAPTQTLQVIVEGQGSVRPTDEIDLVPQVPGVVVWKAYELEAGGYFARGDVLLRIDPRDYELAATRAEASVARARFQLDVAQEEAAVARQEWEMVREHRGLASLPTDLVLRLPQVRAAEADLLAAEAGLAEARLRLERTQIRAPFHGRVRETTLDAGQYVVANQPVCRIYSIERAEIVVAVPDEDMEWLVIPRQLPDMPMASLAATGNTASITPGAYSAEDPQPPAPMSAAPRARVYASFAGKRHTWDGFVSRAAAELDARSRMLRLVIEVDAPYASSDDNEPPLLVGMFVDVEILGEPVDDVRVLPRVALHEGDVVWVASGEGILHMRQVQVVRIRHEEVLVRFDLASDEKVIVSQLSGATDGMKVRIQNGASQS
jgi:RND family efflux transporter MFP subunit